MFARKALLCLSLLATFAAANPSAADQFKSPPATSRAKFRYWIPDASVTTSYVQQDIADLAAKGAGGFELVPFYAYGNPTDAALPTDWNTYGFGTEAFRNVFDTALQAAVDNSLLMDFSLGASQGQGTPAEAGTEGLSIHLQLGVMTVRSGSSIIASVPEPQSLTGTLLSGGGFMHGLTNAEKGNLKGVIAGRIIKESESNSSDTTTKVIIDEDSIVDLSPYVNGLNLNWKVPAGNDTWKIFAFWEGFTNQVSCSGGINGTTTIQRGSLAVDHFSKAGAKLHTKFFDDHILTGEATKTNLRANGRYAWEDSMELLLVLPWTRGFLERFESAHGYSLVKYLPLLFNKGNSWARTYTPYDEEYVYGAYTTDHVSVHDANYRQTLSECYQEYLDYHVEWAKSHGIEFSTQVSYNLPLSFLNEIPSVDDPEGESLGFEDILDAYRSLSGPAQLAGRSDISSEVGAVFQPAYSQTIPELLLSIKKSYAGGLTMMVIHGMAYTGPYAQTTWPGYQPFGYGTTDSWSHIQPAWRHMDDVLGYLGRNQHILKSGKPRIDLAIYQSDSAWTAARIYDSDNLQAKGYTYNFIGPQNLQLPAASASNGVLSPDGPSYKALVFLNNTQIDEEVVSKVREFDRAGLPVFFVGEVQPLPLSSRPNEQYNTSVLVEQLIAHGTNIHHVKRNDDLPAALAKASITPRVQFSFPNSSIFSVYRTETQSGNDYVWLFNNANATFSSTPSFQVSKDMVPHLLDAWTGDTRPIGQYSFSNTGMQIPLKLQPYETIIIGFRPLTAKRQSWVTNTSGAVKAVSYTVDGKLYASIKGPSKVRINNTTERSLDAVVPSPTSLKLWNLEIQDWKGDPNDTTSIRTQISTHKFKNQTLLPWKSISPELENVSGIGTYTTNFTVPDIEDIGAYLSVGPIFNTLRVWVNGCLVGPFAADNAAVDISNHIRRGETNNVKVEVSTTLYNRIRAEMNATMCMGSLLPLTAPNYASAGSQSYGLMGPVVLDWVANRILE
ncbi:hypothetical protein IFM58399_06440 [Aspergillus lentulus]|uniref:Secreted protein n=1 Tax=Aspergillus lentulus TaxID=293939 RepID=A0AAN5YRX7_ASPLE|nr:uncharacterized protein IFM58399_06440 [Aspergillus lentulus]KAF4153197.1 hypothetical protein CNMCM6069_001090 [Aspergillus lentulus]KAF4205415.1 hypothetical protein CNMCM8927_006285 [Aspergillus lentulus]GFF41933.1 hypothetical protein IFM58399_06440 [Aspergillus lentulus]GFF84254.1 hypothetical protein IFM60648_06967 [Aspergillus lentulus]